MLLVLSKKKLFVNCISVIKINSYTEVYYHYTADILSILFFLLLQLVCKIKFKVLAFGKKISVVKKNTLNFLPSACCLKHT